MMDSLIVTNFLLALLILIYVAVNWEAIVETLLQLNPLKLVLFVTYLISFLFWLKMSQIFWEHGTRVGYRVISDKCEELLGYGEVASLAVVGWMVVTLAVIRAPFEIKGGIDDLRVWILHRKIRHRENHENKVGR